MKTDQLCFAGVASLRGIVTTIGVAVLLLSRPSPSPAYPIGPELPDDGFFSTELPLPPLGNIDDWTVQYPGNLTPQFPAMDPADPVNNSFADPADLGLGGSPSDSHWAVPYDGTNTNESYFGDDLGTGSGFAQFGLDLGAVDSAFWLNVTPTDQFFADGGVPQIHLPAIGFAPVPAVTPGGPFHYVVLYLEAAIHNASTVVRDWFEIPFKGAVPQIQLTIGSQPVDLSHVGFFTSDTQIPLDDLNSSFLPPPGQTGSQFTPLSAPDGAQLSGGGQITVTLPEPGSWALMVLGSLAVVASAGYRRCRNAS